MGEFYLDGERPRPKHEDFIRHWTNWLLQQCVEIPSPYWPQLVNTHCQRLLDAGHNEAAVRRIYRRVVRELQLDPGTQTKKAALILVDLQNDFLPGGALPVPEGDGVLPVAAELQCAFQVVIATQDWHPPGHVSFAANHPGSSMGDVIETDGCQQKLWPVHCVQNTHGAALSDRLDKDRITRVIQKGTDEAVDSYSGFFDDCGRSTGLKEYLYENGVTTVYVMGLATEYCVRRTALDAQGSGFEVFLVRDGCRGVDRDDEIAALAEVDGSGVKIVDSAEVFG